MEEFTGKCLPRCLATKDVVQYEITGFSQPLRNHHRPGLPLVWFGTEPTNTASPFAAGCPPANA